MVPFVPLFDRLVGYFLPQYAVNYLNGDVANRYAVSGVGRRTAIVAFALRGAARKCVGISWHWLGQFWVSEIAAMTLNGAPAALPTRSSASRWIRDYCPNCQTAGCSIVPKDFSLSPIMFSIFELTPICVACACKALTLSLTSTDEPSCSKHH